MSTHELNTLWQQVHKNYNLNIGKFVRALMISDIITKVYIKILTAHT